MSDIRIKFNGPEERYSEVAVTGQQQVWLRGQSSFVTGANAALLLATGKFTQPSSGEVGTAQDPLTGLDVLDAGSKGVLAASGAIGSKLRRNYKIVLDGDSTVQAQLLSYPQTEAAKGWRYVPTLTLTPAQAATWIMSFNLSYNCASGDAATIDFNGTDVSIDSRDGCAVQVGGRLYPTDLEAVRGIVAIMRALKDRYPPGKEAINA